MKEQERWAREEKVRQFRNCFQKASFSWRNGLWAALAEPWGDEGLQRITSQDGGRAARRGAAARIGSLVWPHSESWLFITLD